MKRKAPEPPLVEVTVDHDRWTDLDFDPVALAGKIVPLAMKSGGARGAVSLLLTGDKAIRVLNRDYRGKDKATNVLSFPMEEKGFLGDIAIAFETTRREAKAMDMPFRNHFIHLLIHGTLHLQGHDHIAEEDAIRMEALEISILKSLRIKNPYAHPRFMA